MQLLAVLGELRSHQGKLLLEILDQIFKFNLEPLTHGPLHLRHGRLRILELALHLVHAKQEGKAVVLDGNINAARHGLMLAFSHGLRVLHVALLQIQKVRQVGHLLAHAAQSLLSAKLPPVPQLARKHVQEFRELVFGYHQHRDARVGIGVLPGRLPQPVQKLQHNRLLAPRLLGSDSQG